ncbi:MAG: hypothetical protein JW828_07915 [Sedimentisphaerales bacterium]|nr:hypothetical protein [Sedimentisphaerales bacterium]
MNSRERVLASLNHRQPDRVCIDFGGHRSSGIMAIVYAKLKKALGITSGDIYIYDLIQQLAIVEPPVQEAFGVDTVEMGRAFLTEDKDWKDWILPDGTPCKIPFYINLEKRGDDWILLGDKGQELAIQKKGCLYFEQTYWPMADRDIREDDFSDLEEQLGNHMWATAHPGAHLPLDEAGLSEMTQRAKTLRESTDRAIIGLFGGNMFEVPQMLLRMDNYLMYLGLYPEHVERLSEKLCSVYLNNLEKWLGAVGPYIDVILFGDDLGSQMGPLISPQMYRRFFKPYHKRLWNRARELADVKVNLHCCGSVAPLLDDIIDAGADAINPVQVGARNMDAPMLKERFGDRICLWGGGCDTQTILPDATPEQIAEHVKKQIDILHPGGGFVFQQVHNIMANVSPQNIIAMFEAAGNK